MVSDGKMTRFLVPQCASSGRCRQLPDSLRPAVEDRMTMYVLQVELMSGLLRVEPTDTLDNAVV